MKILDCTLRDGGYYTNWDFEDNVVDVYVNNINGLPIDYIELGYRNKPQTAYMGRFGYCPLSVLRRIRSLSDKRLAIMLNEKDTAIQDLSLLLEPIEGVVDMVRLAVDPKNFDRALCLAKEVKKMGFEVAFNTMYMSKWDELTDFYPKLSALNGVVDVFCMVDSFGGVTPQQVADIIHKIRQYASCAIGFHGHNNLQLALINTLTAIDNGVDYVDATMLGMGRGAGNLNMELLLTYLNKQAGVDVDFNKLGDVVSVFQPLYDKYGWGTSLPYMISGTYSFPQKEVMEMVTNRVYSFDSIVRSLQNRANNSKNESRYPILDSAHFDNVLIIGGGTSPVEHLEGIKTLISSLDSVAIVFATARHATCFSNINVAKFYCLSGKEAKRLAKMVNAETFGDSCVLGAYPRRFGTEVPDFCRDKTYEIKSFDFTNNYQDSCTAISIQLAIDLHPTNIYVAGYDGYRGKLLSERELSLNKENESLFSDYMNFANKKLVSITPSVYEGLENISLYQIIQNK